MPHAPRSEHTTPTTRRSGGVSRRTVVQSAIVPAIALAARQAHSKTGESTNMASPPRTLPYLPTSAQAELIRNGDLSSEELVRLYLERIERFNPRLNAVVALAEDALERAREADAALAEGRSAGPLHGVPMTIKDCFDTAGTVSTWGTIGRRDFVPATDATVVARLKAAGGGPARQDQHPGVHAVLRDLQPDPRLHEQSLRPRSLSRRQQRRGPPRRPRPG